MFIPLRVSHHWKAERPMVSTEAGMTEDLQPKTRRLPVLRQAAVALGAENGVAFHNHDGFKAAASGECFVFNLDNALGNADFFQIPAALKSLPAYASESLRKNNLTELIQTVELAFVDVRNPVRDYAPAISDFKSSFHLRFSICSIHITDVFFHRYHLLKKKVIFV